MRFKIGDIVNLNSGGPDMKILKIYKSVSDETDILYKVRWKKESNEMIFHYLPELSLKKKKNELN